MKQSTIFAPGKNSREPRIEMQDGHVPESFPRNAGVRLAALLLLLAGAQGCTKSVPVPPPAAPPSACCVCNCGIYVPTLDGK
jgi:hypothetical protein